MKERVRKLLEANGARRKSNLSVKRCQTDLIF